MCMHRAIIRPPNLLVAFSTQLSFPVKYKLAEKFYRSLLRGNSTEVYEAYYQLNVQIADPGVYFISDVSQTVFCRSNAC